MVKLNGEEYAYRPGMSLKELMDDYNSSSPRLAFDGFVVVVNGSAINTAQAKEKLLLDNDNIFIVPILDGG